MSSFKLRNVLNTSLILFLFNTFLFLSYASDDDHISSSSLYSINKDKGKERLYGGPEELENGHKEAHRRLFYGHLQEVRTQVFLNMPSHPTIFLCYDQNDIGSRAKVKLLAQDLSCAGIPQKNIFYDDCARRPGGELNKLQYSDQISSSERVIVIGSPSLVKPDEQMSDSVRTDINLLRTRLSQKGAKGIIPVWFEGKYQDNFPQGIHFLNFRFLGNSYFYPFFDLLIDIYQLNPVKNTIFKYQEEFLRRCKNIPEEALVSFQGALEQSSEAVRENDKRVIAEMLARDEYKDQGLAVDLITSEIPLKKASYQEPASLRGCEEDKPHPRPWIRITDKVLEIHLPDRPEDFVESASGNSQETYLTLLWQKLYRTGIATLSSSTSLSKATVSGMGGLGKTTLALAYAYEAVKYKAYNLIAWIPSETQDELISGYKYLLRRLEISLKEDEDSSFVIDRVKEELLNQGRCLLIYDNVPSSDFLKNKVPQMGVDILITSRCNYGWGKDSCIGLNVFRLKDSIDYLFKATSIERNEETQGRASKLAEALGNLPLALSHAAGYINYMNNETYNSTVTYGFDAYLQEFNECPENHFISHINPFEEEINEDEETQPTGFKEKGISHHHLIARTWGLAGKKITPLAKDLMRYFAYLDPDNIVEETFLSFAKGTKTLREAFAQLCRFSLIKESYPFYSIHRLMQLAIRQEQETSSFDNLKISLALILSSFEECLQGMEQKLQRDLSLADLNNIDDQVSAMSSSCTTLFTHLQRIIKSHPHKENEYFPLKFEALGLKWLLRHPSLTSLLTSKIYKVLKHEDSSEKKEKQRKIALRKELEKKKINLKEETFEATLEYLPRIISLKLLPKYLMFIIQSVAETPPQERGKFVEDIVTLLESQEDTIRLLYPSSSDELKVMVATLQSIWGKDTERWQRFADIQALFKLSSAERKEFIQYLPFLWTEGMSRQDKESTIEAFVKVPAAEREELINYLSSLWTEGMSRQDKEIIIEAFVKVPVSERKEFIQYLPFLWTEGMSRQDKENTIKAFVRVPVSKRKEFIQYLPSLWTKDMSVWDKESIIKAFVKVPASEREEFINYLPSLWTEGMSDWDKASTIEAFVKVPAAEREEFIKYLPSLWTKDMSVWDKESIIKAFVKVPAAEREEFIKYHPSLWTEGMSDWDKASTIEDLVEVPSAEREEFIKYHPSLWTEGMSSWDKESTIEDLVKVPASEREEFIKYHPSLWTEGMSSWDKESTIEDLVKVPASEREEFIKYLPSLWTKDMEAKDKARIIEAFVKVPASEREALTKSFNLLWAEDVKGSYAIKILKNLATIPYDQRKNIYPLLNKEMHAYNKTKILEALVKVEPIELEGFVKNALLLPHKDTSISSRTLPLMFYDNQSELQKVDLITALSKVGAKQLDELMPVLISCYEIIQKDDFITYVTKLAEVPSIQRVEFAEKFMTLVKLSQEKETLSSLNKSLKQIVTTILHKGKLSSLLQILEKAVE
ncbi:hypothetical protein IM40_09825 (plasmid) [Candidatus Paracaedimonas acanthamoebae]|nr:hypothetical protein IM40_09825 [Candidatus Paracaedimonas acanthamoebae]